MLRKRKEKLKAEHPPGTNVWFRFHKDDNHEVQGTVVEVSGLYMTLRLGTGQVIRINTMDTRISTE